MSILRRKSGKDNTMIRTETGTTTEFHVEEMIEGSGEFGGPDDCDYIKAHLGTLSRDEATKLKGEMDGIGFLTKMKVTSSSEYKVFAHPKDLPNGDIFMGARRFSKWQILERWVAASWRAIKAEREKVAEIYNMALVQEKLDEYAVLKRLERQLNKA